MTLFTIIFMGVIVFVLRFSFFAMPKDWTVPVMLERSLFYVLPAVLMGMLIPGVLLTAGGEFRAPLNPYMIGAAVGFGVAAFRRNNFFLVFGSSVAAFALAKVVLG
ncbi:AzlD domain-containing protein [Nonomuraea sp. KM90]|uniref:AzlD domain-containing protein n=1 Tax=Nonomuraea sp. KM90 TaxID=3457428 RepID=UPI003FCD3C36